jgi:hypothetical protein
MSCIELENELRVLIAERKTECECAPFAGHNEAEARRDAEIADRQIFAIDLQIDRIERALEDCRAYGGRR